MATDAPPKVPPGTTAVPPAAFKTKRPLLGHRRSRVDRWPIHVALTLICLIVGFPLFYAMIVATQGNTEFFANQITPGNRLADNFQIVWRDRNLGGYLWNSTIQAIIITVGKTITALLCGLAFVHLRFPFKGPIFWLVLVTLMMPTEISILALFQIVSGLGWANSMLGLTIPFLASATGAFLFRQHFANLPSDLSEAAQLDGAKPLQFLFKILLPLSWNVIGALAVIQFLYSWNMYLWPLLIISEQSEQVVQIGLGTLRNTGGGQSYGPLMLGAVLASIPPTLVFIGLQKQFLSGFSINAEK
jgi:sn-glycerol 3-phosphate transport system permease protein